jgi:hypothetical protein
LFVVADSPGEGMTVEILTPDQRQMGIEKGEKKQGYRYS